MDSVSESVTQCVRVSIQYISVSLCQSVTVSVSQCKSWWVRPSACQYSTSVHHCVRVSRYQWVNATESVSQCISESLRQRVSTTGQQYNSWSFNLSKLVTGVDRFFNKFVNQFTTQQLGQLLMLILCSTNVLNMLHQLSSCKSCFANQKNY